VPVGFVGRIAATGYFSSDEQYYNAYLNGPDGERLAQLNTGDRLTVGQVYYADGHAFPNKPSGAGDDGWYGAASFTFEPAAATTTVPEPGTWALLGRGLLAIGGIAARRRTHVASDRSDYSCGRAAAVRE
jgi:hypothetical protein